MSEMIERIARRIATKHYAERFSKEIDDPHVVMNVNGNWNIFETQVRAVIEAMRPAGFGDLPEEMMVAGEEAFDRAGIASYGAAHSVFVAMIDAALAAPQRGGQK